MIDDDEMEFECMNCGVMFKCTHCGIDREVERVRFPAQGFPEVEARGIENIGSFCSLLCRERGREDIMRAQGVPIRRVGIGPVETCARCGGPVDMTSWHLTFLDIDSRFSGSIAHTLDIDYLAVLCLSCMDPEVAAFAEAIGGTAREDEVLDCSSEGILDRIEHV